MTYQSPPWDEPRTPGHTLACCCHFCCAEQKKHRELLEAEMERQAELVKPPSPRREFKPPEFTHSLGDLLAMASSMFFERVCFVGFAPVHLVNKKD